MVTSYKTIKSTTEGLYKEKGSKFIAIALPVKNKEAIAGHLTAIKKQYYDARHHCYAYILGPAAREMRANDDGEPGHSAGDPILGQIKSLGLTNTLVVVVRYFGGTKLGVGGLINAYKTAARLALARATVVTRTVTQPITLVFPYAATNEVMQLVDSFTINITAQKFDAGCRLTGEIAVDQTEALRQKVALLQNLGTQLTLII